MNKKRKICVTTGTRAEYGLLKPILNEISKSKKLDLYLIVTGMHLSKKHGYTISEIINDGFSVYSKIEMIPKGNSSYFMANSLGKGVIEFSQIFKKPLQEMAQIYYDIKGSFEDPDVKNTSASYFSLMSEEFNCSQ